MTHAMIPEALVGRVDEQFIGTVDVWQLNQMRRPILRVFARTYVDQLELRHHLQGLLGTGVWRSVRAVPHVDPARRYQHVFDIFGRSADGV